MKGRAAEYAKLIRLPGLGGLSVPAVFGALSVEAFEMSELCLLFLLGILAVIYGFVLNDYLDSRLDRLSEDLSEKPLVSGTISSRAALSIVMLSFALVYLITFLYFRNLLAVLVITLSAIMATFYNLYGKRVVGSDVLVAGATALLCLFGAAAVVSPDRIGGLTWIIVLLTFNQTFYMNAIEGGLKDADHDYLMGVRNIALFAGVKVDDGRVEIPWRFTALGIGIRAFSAILLFVPFIFLSFPYEAWQIGLMFISLIGIFYASIRMLITRSFNREEIRRLISVQAFLRYSVVPLMLINVIGILGALAMILMPILWYMAFTPLVKGKLFQPIL